MGNIVAAALAEEETHSLDYGHHGKDHTHRTGGGVRVKHAYKEGIGLVVKGGDQHADNAGDCQAADDAAHRRLGHGYEFLFLCIHMHRLFFCDNPIIHPTREKSKGVLQSARLF